MFSIKVTACLTSHDVHHVYKQNLNERQLLYIVCVILSSFVLVVKMMYQSETSSVSIAKHVDVCCINEK